MTRLAIGMVVEVQKTLAVADTISAITKANPAVMTLTTGHGLTNGVVVKLTVFGMGELDGQAARIAGVTATTAELEGIDSTSFGTFTSGSLTEVTAWDQFTSADDVQFDSAEAEKKDITRLIDKQRKQIFGLRPEQSATITAFYDPQEVAQANLKAATNANADRAIRITWPDGGKSIFNAYVALNPGFTLDNDVAKTQCAITLRGWQVAEYVS